MDVALGCREPFSCSAGVDGVWRCVRMDTAVAGGGTRQMVMAGNGPPLAEGPFELRWGCARERGGCPPGKDHTDGALETRGGYAC